MKSLSSFLILLLTVSLLTAPAFAQDLSFDGDEIQFDDNDISFDDDDLTFDDDTLTFDEEDDLTFGDDVSFDINLDVGVLVVPGGELDEPTRNQLQRKLLQAVQNVPDITVFGDGDLLPALIDRDPEFCTTEALCLASIGRAAGVERIVFSRVTRTPEGLRFEINHFDVQDRLFVAYYTRNGLSTLDAIDELIQPGVNEVFNIRERRRDDGFVDQNVDVPRVMAYTSGGLSLVALGVGAFFGLRASSQQKELNSLTRDEEGRFTNLSQIEAQNRVRQLESSAFNANLSTGIGSALAITSIALFVVSARRGDTDVNPRASLHHPWYVPADITPRFSPEHLGFGARWNF